MFTEEKQNFLTSQDSEKFPKNEKEVSSFIKEFYKSATPVEIVGSGSKRKIGKLLQCAKTLNLSKLNGIIDYIPEELYIKVNACTSVELIEKELKKIINNWHLNQLILDICLMEKAILVLQPVKLLAIFLVHAGLKLVA